MEEVYCSGASINIEKINLTLLVSSCVMFAVYAFLLSAATYNTIRFVFGSSRYQNFHITYFYVLVYLVIALRVMWLAVLVYLVDNSADYIDVEDYGDSKLKTDSTVKAIFYLDVAATYFELLIGI